MRGVAGRSGGSTRWHFLIGGGFPVVTGGFPVVTWGSTSRFFAPPNSWQQHHKYNNRRRFSREPHRPNFAGVECAAHQHRPAPAQATCRGEPACGPFDATNDMIKLRCLSLRAQKTPLDSELSASDSSPPARATTCQESAWSLAHSKDAVARACFHGPGCPCRCGTAPAATHDGQRMPAAA